jgi:hypothetical protein
LYRNINLFEGEICCESCGNSWSSYSHGFSRGHIIFNKENRFILVCDDICYGFPSGTSFDIESIFEKRGWLSLSRCPICHTYLSKIKQRSNKDRHVVCDEVTSEDFHFLDGVWDLKQKVILEKDI